MTEAGTHFMIFDIAKDNVAVAVDDIQPGTRFRLDEKSISTVSFIPKGQRFAIRDIPVGNPVNQYGSAFGLSRGIRTGEMVGVENILDIENSLEDVPSEFTCPETEFSPAYLNRTFQGYRRQGRLGTRNYYLIVPTSQCASAVAVQIAERCRRECNADERFPNVDGIIPIPNTEGCGCAANVQIERFLRVLGNFITHPNAGRVLVIDLGCEQTDRRAVRSSLVGARGEMPSHVDWLTIQEEGGTRKTIEKSVEIVAGHLPELNAARRSPCAIEHLVVGTECGASDSFSGITANPAIGNAVDRLVSGKGSAILSEVPEMIGAEHALMRRMRDAEVMSKFRAMMGWYKEMAGKLQVNMSDNLVPANKAGGLINASIKSLGAIAKGGNSRIEDVLDYGQAIERRGLNLMQGPGNDLESVTGLTSSGATVICFSTGKGTVTGSAIVPCIKISSTSGLYDRMSGDIDFNAGVLIDRTGNHSIEEVGGRLFELIIEVASGKKTKAELNEQRQFQIWTAGKLAL